VFRTKYLTILVAAVAACENAPRTGGAEADTGLALARSSRAKDSLIQVKDSLLALRSRQLSEQSQLIGDAATSARLAAQIDQTLSAVRGLRSGSDTVTRESPGLNAADQLASAEQKVRLLVDRLNASEARVRRMRRDSTTHSEFDATQQAQLRDYERSLGELRSTVDRQRQEIAVLTQRVDSVVQVNVALAARNDSVVARNVAMSAREDSVFVFVGTEKELISRGIARKEGGNKLLFGMGRTLVPARSLDRSVFRVMSKSKDLTIPLPDPQKPYRVVSRHNLSHVQLANAKDPSIRGSLTITDPEAFWSASKYLILVQH
jgi:hypothetical protein